MGINRNIVECKVSFSVRRLFAVSVLIETSWNVKLSTLVLITPPETVLIETSWNVKYFAV